MVDKNDDTGASGLCIDSVNDGLGDHHISITLDVAVGMTWFRLALRMSKGLWGRELTTRLSRSKLGQRDCAEGKSSDLHLERLK